MKASVLAAVLALAPALASRSQARTLAGISDTAETRQAMGIPWIARSSAEAFYLAAPEDAGGSAPYQVSAYQGVTLQSLSFAWFHAGWRYRETLAPGLSTPYRQAFDLKLMATVELLRGHLFASLGGNLPLLDGRVQEQDTLALFQSLSGYSPLPAPNYLSPQGLQVAAFGRYPVSDWDLMAGFAYARSSRFEPVAGRPFQPASYLDGTLRAVLATGRAQHRWDAKVAVFGEEETVEEAAAHKEGSAWQLRYAYLRSSARTAWQLGGGALVKTTDANRLLRLRTSLEPAESNDNLQRGYAELAFSWTPRPYLLWRAHLLPKALLQGSTRETGHETELGLTLGLRLWELHRLRATGSLLTGSFAGREYLGLAGRVEFAFRHLGIQDLETGEDRN